MSARTVLYIRYFKCFRPWPLDPARRIQRLEFRKSAFAWFGESRDHETQTLYIYRAMHRIASPLIAITIGQIINNGNNGSTIWEQWVSINIQSSIQFRSIGLHVKSKPHISVQRVRIEKRWYQILSNDVWLAGPIEGGRRCTTRAPRA